MVNPRTTRRPRRAAKQARAEETIDAIIESTMRVVAARGFQAATTSEIAREAGVSVGTLYRYYPSKDALLNALVRHRWESLSPTILAAAAAAWKKPLREGIEDVVATTVESIANLLSSFGVLDVDTSHLVEVPASDVARFASALSALLEPIRDRLAPDDLEEASLVVVRSVMFMSRVGQRDYPDRIARGTWQRQIARMISSYLLRPGS